MRLFILLVLIFPVATLSAQLIVRADQSNQPLPYESENALAWSAARDFPDEFFRMHFPPDYSYTGLFPTEINGTYELRPLSTEIRGHRLRLHEFTCPLWVFADRFTGPPQITRGISPDTCLQTGDSFSVREGRMFASESIDTAYELWFRPSKSRKELLLRTETYHRVEINFVGDLDGDWRDDLLLSLQSSESTWYYGLWTTRDAPPGKHYRAVLLRPVIY